MTLRNNDLASAPTASPAETIAFLAIVGTLVVGVLVAVQVSKRRRNSRPYAAQAAEVAAHFNGAHPVTCYPTNTSLSHEQVCQVDSCRLRARFTARGETRRRCLQRRAAAEFIGGARNNAGR